MLQQLAFDTQSFAMPEGWDTTSPWQVVVHGDGRVLAGGASGLYQLGETIELIDAAPVRALLAHETLGFVVVRDDGVKIYDDALFDAALNDMLDGVEVRSITRRGGEMWLLTDGALLELEDGALWSYPELLDVEQLVTHDAADQLVMRDAAGVSLLRSVEEGVEEQSLSDELEQLSAASPGPQGRLLALVGQDGQLVERVAVEGGVAWQRVALSLDEDDPGVDQITQLVADPVGGSLWLAQGEHLWRLDGGHSVAALGWPDEVSAGAAMVATSDGALWLSQGDALVRVGPDAAPPSYQQHVAPFYAANCAKCHEEGGEVATSTRFGDYDGFAALIELIIEQLEADTMPPGEEALIGDASLPRQWRDGGMRP
jgi:hypothetical protein